MEPESYLVEILHYNNPHLIWVEVTKWDCKKTKNDQFFFEQIGIYGVLPHETTLDVENDTFKTERYDEWSPAATAVMRNMLADAAEVWFSPIHIDRRTSIFDNNCHTYGELIIKKCDGKQRKLSKYLTSSGFAVYDVCLFHKELSLGNLKTKLSHIETEAVINELKMYYKKNLSPKNHWEKSVKKHTTIFQTAQNLEFTLTMKNLEIHNKQLKKKEDLSQVLTKKFRDFSLCKDIDETSMGRAHRTIHLTQVTPETSILLRRKIDLLKKLPGISLTAERSSAIFKDNKLLRPNTMRTAEEEAMRSYKDYIAKAVERKVAVVTENCSSNEIQTPEQHENVNVEQERHEERDTKVPRKKKIARTQNRIPNFDNKKEKLIAFVPPGVDFSKIPLKVVSKLEAVTPVTQNKTEEEIEETNDDNLYAEVDSNVNMEITNKSDLKECYQNIVGNTSAAENVEILDCSKSSDETSSFLNTHKSISNLLERKINLYSRKMSTLLNNIHSSESDTTNKDSSSSAEELYFKRDRNKNDDREKENFSTEKLDSNPVIINSKANISKGTIKEDSDETLDDLTKKLKIDDDNFVRDKVNIPINFADKIQLKNNVNPFKNIDASISVFVDKLVSPVLMVHTKMNKRIQPCFNLRDISFNNHIHMVLKNMSISQPMMLQTISWFTILRGYSLFMVSPKCSGKTLGYIPAVCRLTSDWNNEDYNSAGPTCIIVCATAYSVIEVEKLCKMFMGLEERVLACYAGVDTQDITTSLLNGCDLFVTTPCALVRLLQKSDFDIDLKRLTTLVLDDCERMSVYANEVKYILLKVKEMLKNRANKELKVQYIVASRIWCDFMEPLALKAPNSVVCIGAFQECVLYSKASTTVNFVKAENKINLVLEFLKQIDGSKKTVIVCRSDDEVNSLEVALTKLKYVVYACNNTMTVHDLYNLSYSWNDYREPVTGPILLCCDGNLTHLNVTDAHYLLHYSLPSLFSMFCKRFSVLNDNYASIFKHDNEDVKIKIFIDECNVEQLPKILHFIKRCTDNVPEFLEGICDKVLAEKDAAKAENLVPLCDNLLALGECPDFWNCNERHALLKEYDVPKEWLPRSGVITFKILHYHTAVTYSARLLSNIVNDTTKKYPQAYTALLFQMSKYYSKDGNKKLHGIPKVGDICAVSIQQNLFVRCQVVKILNRYQRGNPNYVLIKLLDEEKWERTRDIYLYHLPEDLKSIQTYVVQVTLVNIKPKDNDVTFSNLAKDQLKQLTDKEDELYMRGKLTAVIGNRVFVETLEACQDLTSLNETVVKHDFRTELLDRHATINPDHVSKLVALCKDIGLTSVQDAVKVEKTVPKELPKASWAHLDKEMTTVLFTFGESPDKFFVRLDKFESCLDLLIKDIETYISEEKPIPVETARKGDIVLARFPDDGMYERARIDAITDSNKVKCFFVDQGDWREVPVNHLVPITEKFITQMPFQAIECRLVGVRPAGNEWTEFSTNWFCDNCCEDNLGNLKQLYIKYFTKEKAECTEGHKYGVVLIDTNTKQDVVINRLIIDVNLAREDATEIKYLNELDYELKRQSNCEDWENENKEENHSQTDDKESIPNEYMNSILFKTPIRSVPLVDEDESTDDERWNMNLTSDFLSIFNCMNPNATTSSNIKDYESDSDVSIKTKSSVTKNGFEMVSSPRRLTELDSDDFSSPENVSSPQKTEKPDLKVGQLRKPKVSWRQNQNFVFVKILLMGVDDYNLEIQTRSLKFFALANDTEYGFEIELYNVINTENSSQENKGAYILLKLIKVLKKNWLTLTRDGSIKKWIVYDMDGIEVSSDEETVQDDTLVNVMKNLCHESESEEDDFDDTALIYKAK